MSLLGPWQLEQDDALAVLTLSKPPLNLFDAEVFDGLEIAVHQLSGNPPRGLLIRAEGKAWTGGVDVKLFHGLSAEGGAELWERGFRVMQAIEDLPVPTVFAAHALCLTWGFELALACDLIVAAKGAKFGLVEIVVGLTPSMGGPQRLAEKAGPGRAKELIFTGDLYDAATLQSWGVVNQVWADDKFDKQSRDLAARIAAGPTRAHAATKRIVAEQKERGTRAADAITPELSGELFATEDLQNAVESFLENGPGHATYAGR
jgi:enoyl-CoA hydratase/carnithine racemase